MPRIPLHDLETAPERAKPFLTQALKSNGYLSNLLAVLANSPAALEAYLTLSGINAKSSLSLEEREVVQLISATTHGCAFCVAGHSAIATNKVQMDATQLDALRSGHALESSRLETLAAFTRAVIRHRGRVPDAELQALRNAGYSDASALEVVLGVSLATLCNFANNFAAPPLNEQLEAYRWSPTPSAE